MGLLQADIVRGEGNTSLRNYQFDRAALVRALSGGGLPLGFGLYVGRDSEILHDEIGFAPITRDQDQRLAGMRITFFGLVMDFVLDTYLGTSLLAVQDQFFQPTLLDFVGPRRSTRVIFTRSAMRNTGNRLGFDVRAVPANGKEGAEIRHRISKKQFDRTKGSAPNQASTDA